MKEAFVAEMECELGREKWVKFRYAEMGVEGRAL